MTKLNTVKEKKHIESFERDCPHCIALIKAPIKPKTLPNTLIQGEIRKIIKQACIDAQRSKFITLIVEMATDKVISKLQEAREEYGKGLILKSYHKRV